MNLEGAPERYSTDFGRLQRRTPKIVVLADRDADVAAALALARDRGLPFSVRGAGHSCHGQTLTDGVAIVNVPNPTDPPRIVGGDLVEIPARSRWREVEAFLAADGRSAPVLADYLDLSVGGTVAVGGYGTESVALGGQADHLERVRLILPDGRAVWCSAREHADLFSYVPGGLGAVGVIDRVVMRTVPARPWSALFTYHYRHLRQLVDSLAWLADTQSPPMQFKALHARGRFVATYGTHAASMREAVTATGRPPAPLGTPARRWLTPQYRRWRDRTVKLWLARFAGHGRLWADYVFDFEGLTRFVDALQPMLDRDAFAGCLKSIYIVAIRRLPRPVGFPLEATEGGTGSMRFGIGLYSMIPRRDSQLADRVRHTVAACLEQCVALGGRPYRYGWHELNEAHLRAIYGRAYERQSSVAADR